MCCASSRLLVSPRLWIQLPPTDPHFTFFPLKEKYNRLAAQRIFKPHAGNSVRQLGDDVT